MNLESWRKARAILCVRLDNAGDVLMTAPAIRALSSGTEGRRITLLCSNGGAAAARLIPEIDEIIAYDAPWMKAKARRENAAEDLAIAEKLRRKSFDAAVIFTVYSQNPLPSAFLCYLAAIPLRASFCRENPYQLLTDWIPDPEPARYIRHEVERQLSLTRSLGCVSGDDRIRIRIDDRSFGLVRSLLADHGIHAGTKWILIHPGASAPSRRYPADCFARACDMIGPGVPLVFTGRQEEEHLIEFIRSRTRARTFSLAGKTGMEELAAAVALSSVVISNNTCTVHLASAAGTPVVDLYALTNPQHTPWKVSHRLLYSDVDCKYCYKSVCPRGHNNCLRLVAPDVVAEAASELLKKTSCILSG